MAPKKTTASKHPRASSLTEYNHSQFVSVDAKARFHVSVTKRSGIKERGFELDGENVRTKGFYKTIQDCRWQLFCQHPKAVAMTVVCEFFANAPKGPTGHKVFVRGKEVKYNSATINSLLRLQYNPIGPDEVDVLLNNDANMTEVT